MEISKTCYDQAKGLEDYCGFLPIKRGTKKPLVKWKDQPHLPLDQALGFKSAAALAVRSPNLLTLDLDSEEAFYFLESKGIDLGNLNTWCIWRSERAKIVYFASNEKLLELPNGELERTINYQDQGLDVFLTNKGYIIFEGEHENLEDYYFSPENFDIAALAPPPKEVWDLVLEIASKEQTSPKKTYPSSTSTRLNPCPICGRDERLWCSESQDGLIFCMNGKTFSSEKEHGFLNLGDVVNGFACVAKGDTCNTFKVHQPRRLHRPHRTKRPTRQLRRAF